MGRGGGGCDPASAMGRGGGDRGRFAGEQEQRGGYDLRRTRSQPS